MIAVEAVVEEPPVPRHCVSALVRSVTWHLALCRRYTLSSLVVPLRRSIESLAAMTTTLVDALSRMNVDQLKPLVAWLGEGSTKGRKDELIGAPLNVKLLLPPRQSRGPPLVARVDGASRRWICYPFGCSLRIVRVLTAVLLAFCVCSARADTTDQDLIAAAGNGDLAQISAPLKIGCRA
jgi:hypothetical protein